LARCVDTSEVKTADNFGRRAGEISGESVETVENDCAGQFHPLGIRDFGGMHG
jgi:hypothetical protein